MKLTLKDTYSVPHYNQFSFALREGISVAFEYKPLRLVVYDNFLSERLCQDLIHDSRSKIQPSTVVDPVTGAHVPHDGRTSEGTYFTRGEATVSDRIDLLIASFLDRPNDTIEDLQILRYGKGGEYRPHYDYFDPNVEGSKKHLVNGGQRVATALLYLNDVTAGGATAFPMAGVFVRPKRGRLLVFSNVLDDNIPNNLSLHGSLPVLAGEKWVATKWIRESKTR